MREQVKQEEDLAIRGIHGTRCFDLAAACAAAQAIQEQFGQTLQVVTIRSSGIARPASGEPYDTYIIEVWRRAAEREVYGEDYWVVGCVDDEETYRSTWLRIVGE